MTSIHGRTLSLFARTVQQSNRTPRRSQKRDQWLKVLSFILLLNPCAYALNPTPKWYAGFIVGGSKPPSINLNVVSPLNFLSGKAELTYSVLGNVGGQLGYRFNQFRVEGEFFYNNNPYKHLHVDGIDIPNAGSPATTIQQLSIDSKTISNPFTFSGYTSTYAFMFNGIYDFYIPNYTNNWAPYVGLGLGYESVKNYFAFFNSDSSGLISSASSRGYRNNANNLAGQAIVGLSYFLTDYTSFAFDYRYLSSTRKNEVANAFNTLKSRPQLYSVNFVFNSAFNFA